MIIYLGHGAAGSAATMRPYIEGLEHRGLLATAVSLPKRKAEAVVQIYRDQVVDLDRSLIGGHSFGGRVASLLAAESTPAGLVLLSYPLHRPGVPDVEVRSAHFSRIACPVLLLSGESDPFARLDLLREAVGRLSHAELVTYPRLGHGLLSIVDVVVDRIAQFVSALKPTTAATSGQQAGEVTF